MALQLFDRVLVTATANTTVSFTLGSAVAGYQSFSVMTNGNTTYYGASDGTNWEVGIGTYSTSGPTLTRSTILSSSNSGSAVTFSGTPNVWIDYPSAKAVTSTGALTSGRVTYATTDGAVNDSANLQFTGSNLLIGQTYDQGTGSLQNTGTATINGNALDKALYLQGGNNLGLYSQDYSQSAWTKNAATITTAYATAPDGTSTANRVVFTAGATSSTQIQQTYTATLSGLTLTVSAWVKSNTSASQTFQLKLTQAGVADHYSADQTATTSWQRFTYTFTFAAGGTGAIIGVANGSDSLAKDLQVWGIQLELGSVASSYTPTTSAIVTTTNNISVPSGSITTSADSTFNTVKVGLGGGNVSSNTSISAIAMGSTATGGNNTTVGYQTLFKVTSGANNSVFGSASMYSLTTGQNNCGFGYNTLNSLVSTSQNNAFGSYALNANTSGTNNNAFGFSALRNNISGSNNVALGDSALYYNTTASNLTALGTSALSANTTNVATLGTITGGSAYTNGTYTGVVMTLSSGSTAVTYPTATIVVSGGAVTTVTLTSNGVGFKDTTTVLTAPAASIGGTGSGFSVPVASLASGTLNTAVGYQALTNNTTGVNNTAIGYQALLANTTGGSSTALGYLAGSSNTTGQVVALGYRTLLSNTTGVSNIGIGVNVATSLQTGNYNIAIGDGAIGANISSASNTAVGVSALTSTTGARNTAFGFYAGYGNASVNANTSGSNNTYIGFQTVGSASGNTNEMVIGYQAVGLGSNTTVIGNSSTTLTKAFGVVTSTVYTVATLPSASTSGIGARAFVSDALAPAFGSTVVTGGAVAVPVYSDGTNWKVG